LFRVAIADALDAHAFADVGPRKVSASTARRERPLAGGIVRAVRIGLTRSPIAAAMRSISSSDAACSKLGSALGVHAGPMG